MNIVIINDFAYINGGAGQIALSSAAALASAGHNVILFSAVAPTANMQQSSPRNFKIVCTNQYDIASDKSRFRAFVQGLWNIKAQRALEELLDTLDVRETIIHVHSWTKSLSSSVVRAAIKKTFPVVLTMHDYFVACPNGGFFDYQRKTACFERSLSFGCVTRNCDVRSYPQKLWRVARQIIQRQAGLVPSGIKNYIAISNFSLQILNNYLPTDSNIYRINNPIDIDHNGCIDVGLNSGFVFVGRLSPEKGAELFAEASQQLGITPEFVGDGNLSALIKEVCPSAIISGWVASENVSKFLKNARALVFPSLLFEGSPLSILEAAAMGIPAIVSDACAGRDLVEDGKTGLWFRSGDVRDLIEKIIMLQDPVLARSMGKAAYSSYWSFPRSYKSHADKLVSCYREIIETCKT
jgi:glycosyltransferase involved in cell wall biosynthesis